MSLIFSKLVSLIVFFSVALISLDTVLNVDAQSTDTESFITTWNILEDSKSLSIPIDNTYSYNYDIDWGDDSIPDSNVTGEISHDYVNAGFYTVKISGNFPAIVLENNSLSASKLSSIEQWGDISWKSMSGAFAGTDMMINAVDIPNLSNVVMMNNMFMDSQFDGDISNWDVSSVTDMSHMFHSSSFFNGDISNWDVSSVTDMSHIFYSSSFNGNISDWNVRNVRNMDSMFELSSFNNNISDWNVSSVTNMLDMFNSSSFNKNISGWDVHNVTSMSSMFRSSSFNGDISNWDVSRVKSMVGMFYGTSFNNNISDWNVRNVANMADMFRKSSFNGDISNWDTRSLTNMFAMFYDSSFNGDISKWDVRNVENMGVLFSKGVLDDSKYDSILGSWSSLSTLQNNISFHAGSAQYCLADARNILIDTYGWEIADGGASPAEECIPIPPPVPDPPTLSEVSITGDSISVKTSQFSFDGAYPLWLNLKLYPEGTDPKLVEDSWIEITDFPEHEHTFEDVEIGVWEIHATAHWDPEVYDQDARGWLSSEEEEDVEIKEDDDGVSEIPKVNPPSNIEIPATQKSTPLQNIALGEPQIIGSDDKNPEISNNAPSYFDVGVTLVEWTVILDDENAENPYKITQKVNLQDTTTPQITITEPAEDTHIKQSHFTLRGTVTDDLSDIWKVEVDIDDDNEYNDVSLSGENWSYVIDTDDVDAENITVKIRAMDTQGNLASMESTFRLSDPDGPSTEKKKPDKPRAVNVSEMSPSEIEISWSEPLSDGNSEITGYKIEFKINSDSYLTLEENTGTTSTSFVHSGVDMDTEYTYRISAINEIGVGPTSVASPSIIIQTPEFEISPIDNRPINENDTITFTAEMTDKTWEEVAFSLDNNTANATINSETGKFGWISPEVQKDMPYTFDIIAEQGSEKDVETVTITVMDVDEEESPEPIGDNPTCGQGTKSEGGICVIDPSVVKPPPGGDIDINVILTIIGLIITAIATATGIIWRKRH